ncbi:hypothetical protein MWH25_10350 [Natroniella acetigena]|uniref:hypothetical protein n=1 Tax=Natroniella acetigena TaxID=52004 RepID=UPI00200B974F|nr:hypothetical protein [Natroniella acetigena]MCK8828131.1 hypothetical protein [Natroniella acetigena]
MSRGLSKVEKFSIREELKQTEISKEESENIVRFINNYFRMNQEGRCYAIKIMECMVENNLSGEQVISLLER